ncbi:MAG: hypothetical protein KW793_01470 [Candidatus Doudnabacteria bacterium]|nr:hypothetical protein [Candidatus Doudnabacteria bacterium]
MSMFARLVLYVVMFVAIFSAPALAQNESLTKFRMRGTGSTVNNVENNQTLTLRATEVTLLNASPYVSFSLELYDGTTGVRSCAIGLAPSNAMVHDKDSVTFQLDLVQGPGINDCGSAGSPLLSGYVRVVLQKNGDRLGGTSGESWQVTGNYRTQYKGSLSFESASVSGQILGFTYLGSSTGEISSENGMWLTVEKIK